MNSKIVFYLIIALCSAFLPAAGMIQAIPQNIPMGSQQQLTQPLFLHKQSPEVMPPQQLSQTDRTVQALIILGVSPEQSYNDICKHATINYNDFKKSICNKYRLLRSSYKDEHKLTNSFFEKVWELIREYTAINQAFKLLTSLEIKKYFKEKKSVSCFEKQWIQPTITN